MCEYKNFIKIDCDLTNFDGLGDKLIKNDIIRKKYVSINSKMSVSDIYIEENHRMMVSPYEDTIRNYRGEITNIN